MLLDELLCEKLLRAWQPTVVAKVVVVGAVSESQGSLPIDNSLYLSDVYDRVMT